MSKSTKSSNVTLVIACYNEGEILRRAIKSVANQSKLPYEIIVINDASMCDITNNICRELTTNENYRVVWSPKNGGQSQNRNIAFTIAKTDWVMFLDADDELPEKTIENVESGILENPEADFLYGNYYRTDVSLNKKTIVDCSEFTNSDGYIDNKKLLDKWTLSCHVPCQKKAWKAIGGYDQNFSYDYQDVDFFLRLLSKGMKGRFINGYLYHWIRTDYGMNSKLVSRSYFFNAYSYSYYEKLGGINNYWEKVIIKFLENRNNTQVRKDARKLIWRLFPTKFSRLVLYAKFIYHLCLPKLT